MAFLEVAGRPLGVKGLISSMRPKRYYTIQRDSVEKLFNEAHDLSNFFLLEFQRVVYVEDIFATGVVSILLLPIFPSSLTLGSGICDHLHRVFPYKIYPTLGAFAA